MGIDVGEGGSEKRQSCLLLLSLYNSFSKMKFEDANITFIFVKYFHLKKLKRLYLMGDNDKL